MMFQFISLFILNISINLEVYLVTGHSLNLGYKILIKHKKKRRKHTCLRTGQLAPMVQR